jgi:PadR family transcriptional regulator PadR
MPPTPKQTDLLQGTLNMMVLRILRNGKANGYEIAKMIEQKSEDLLQVDHGSLYPALRRLEARDWIKAEWQVSPTNRKARYYSLTPAGRKQVTVEHSRWQTLVHAITRVMGPA